MTLKERKAHLTVSIHQLTIKWCAWQAYGHVYLMIWSKGGMTLRVHQEHWPPSPAVWAHTEALLSDLLPEWLWRGGSREPARHLHHTSAYPASRLPRWMPLLWGMVPYHCRMLQQVKGWLPGSPIFGGPGTSASWVHTSHHPPLGFRYWRHRVCKGTAKISGW